MTLIFIAEIHAQTDIFPRNIQEHKLHEWLSWGEFDSVVSVLEPALKQDTALPSPWPVPWVWLGVAYHGLNRDQAGEDAFRQAILSDTAVPWEPALASPEITSHFQELLEAEKTRRRAAASRVAVKSETPTLPPPANVPSSNVGTKRALAWAAAGTSLIAAGGAIAWWLWKDEAPVRENITSIGPAPSPE